MPGKILIVDDIPTNRIILRVRLSAAFYDVMQASSAVEALDLLERQTPDLVLLSAGLPDCDCLDLCRRIRKRTPPVGTDNGHETGAGMDRITLFPDAGLVEDTACPAVLILAPDNNAALRLAALDAGAEDVLTHPLDDVMLQARLRSLMRVGEAAQETHMRDTTSRALGFAEAQAPFPPLARICILTGESTAAQPWLAGLDRFRVGQITCHDSQGFLREMTHGAMPDLCVIVVETGNQPAAALRVVSGLRTHPETRHAAIMVLLDLPDSQLAADALDLGAGDVVCGSVSPAELSMRMDRQIRRKRMADQLRSTLRDGLRAAVTDPLTGLYNRRYALPHLARLAEHATQSGRRFAVMLADLDHFKSVNDRFGHAAGDAVLIEVAQRLRGNLRAVDMVARIGGEEFLIVLPDTDRTEARIAARRLCRIVAQDGFHLPGQDGPVGVTLSIGVAMGLAPDDCDDQPLSDRVQGLLHEADQALYQAKACGRNQVTIRKPAA
ncbi:MAG: diguanylate cyclase [Paracoccaceae bacterium]